MHRPLPHALAAGGVWHAAPLAMRSAAPLAAFGCAAGGGISLPQDPSTARQFMIENQIRTRGVANPEVLRAMGHVPRHLFVPTAWREQAHADHPLSIGHAQTISQPYIVALMSELAGVGPGDRVLEVGTGSGYQAAVLAAIGCEVYSVEIVAALALDAAARLATLGYAQIQVRTGDGYQGWPEAAPFAAILVTAAPAEIPPPLLQQLAPAGRLVIPVGGQLQELTVAERTATGWEERRVLPVRFVPMTGEARREPGTRR